MQHVEEANRELREQLALLQPSDGKFFEGNALFTDVEDQRIALEKELISLKARLRWAAANSHPPRQIQHAALQTNFDNAVKQRQQLRAQVQMMMHMSSNEADTAMLKRVEEAYAQALAELNQLAAKYILLQKKDARRTTLLSEVELSGGAMSLNEKVLIEFLQQGVQAARPGGAEPIPEISQLKQEKEDLDKQLRTKYMQQVNETSKLREAEKKLHAAESRLAGSCPFGDSWQRRIQSLKVENMQQHLKHEELEFQCAASLRKPMARGR